MARQPIGIGTIANDGTGDPLRDAFDKINDNFIELYDDDANDVNSVNGQTGTVILDTDDIGEGATNKYDKTVVLTEGDNVTITGTYPNFTISSNDVVGEVSSVSAGDGISVNSTTGNVIVTNTITNNNQLTNGAGYVDGSGTANYIPKWTDGDTIGNSVIYDDGTNVGIGTSNPNVALQIGDGTTSVTQAIDSTNGGSIAFRKSGVFSAFVGEVAQGLGTGDGLLLYTYSGADRPIRFWTQGSEKMRIQSSGNVGIGTDSPAAGFHNQTVSNTNASGRFNTKLIDTSSVASGVGAGISLGYQYQSGSYVDGATMQVFKENATSGDYASGLAFTTRINGGNLTERMRITSGGTVKIGDGTYNAQIHFPTATYNNYIGYDGTFDGLQIATNGEIKFQAGSGYAERMRLHSTGDISFRDTSANEAFYWDASTASLGIGTTSPNQKLSVVSGGSLTRANITNTDNAALGAGIQFTVQSGGSQVSNATIRVDNTGKVSIFNGINTSEAERMRIEANGQGYFHSGLRVGGLYITALQGNAQLTNASTSSGSNPSYIGQGLISVTISDEKSKENFGIVEENECLNEVVSLSKYVKKFDWIDEDWKAEKGRTIGMVAQEVNEEFSKYVHKPKNYEDDGWAIRYQEIVPTLIKAIQELKAEIELLKTK